MTVRSFLTGVHTLKTNKPGEAEAQDGELALYESGPSELSRGGALEMAELRSRPRRAARPGLLMLKAQSPTGSTQLAGWP